MSEYSGPAVVGVGLGRTGTNSLQKALEILGFDPCYHGYRVMPGSTSNDSKGKNMGSAVNDLDFWLESLRLKKLGRGNEIDFRKFFQERPYKATQDIPFCHFYEEIADQFPETKFILTVRDREKWYQSFVATIVPVFCGRRLKVLSLISPVHRKVHSMMWQILDAHFNHEGGVFNKDLTMKAFDDHTEIVKCSIPREKLLVFDVREGWGPLCEFLHVPVPDEPFPNVNDTAQILQVIANTRLKTNLFFVGIGTVAATGLFGLHLLAPHIIPRPLAISVFALSFFGFLL